MATQRHIIVRLEDADDEEYMEMVHAIAAVADIRRGDTFTDNSVNTEQMNEWTKENVKQWIDEEEGDPKVIETEAKSA